jgi:hypothetical protein
MPEWLCVMAARQLSSSSSAAADIRVFDRHFVGSEAQRTRSWAPRVWRQIVQQGAREGKRNDTITRLCGHLLRRNVDAFEVLELMQAWNAFRCRPPLPEREVTGIVGSIASRELRRRGGG